VVLLVMDDRISRLSNIDIASSLAVVSVTRK
jgi:hypothetical protein